MIRELLPLVVDFGFNKMKLLSIDAGVHNQNLRSIKVLEKNGFLLKEILPDGHFLYNLKKKY